MPEHTNSLGQPIGAPLKTNLPRPLPPDIPLIGRTCSVVPLDPQAHARDLFNAYVADTNDRVWTYLPYGPFHDFAEFQNWLQITCTGSDPKFHTILNAQGTPVGVASYLRITPATGVIEVGHINFSPALQRTATASEAMFLMMSRVFDELGYRRYEWKCDALNSASCRAAARLGFTFEGTFRQATHYKGRNRDTAWYAIIDQDWPRIKSGFQRWLSSDNFDRAGQQINRLNDLIKG